MNTKPTTTIQYQLEPGWKTPHMKKSITPPPVLPTITPSTDISMNDRPPINAWNTNSAGATNKNENSRGSVIPDTNDAATPAIIRALTFSFFSAGEV